MEKRTKSDVYYKQFSYRIEKKISVEDYYIIKDYAKKQLYLYIIHDNIDNNRFLFISSQHYEEHTFILPESFKLESISGLNESIYLKKDKNKFNVPYFNISKTKSTFSIMLKDVITGKSKTQKVFKKFKVHTKKIALDNPNWYLKIINKNNCIHHKKKILKLLLCGNKYNSEIINHSISTFFILNNPDYQRFNDHSLILDEGKTGKSSLIGYMGEKVDNVSIAGLYGSSDGKNGKFRGGLVTTTNKTILIDEVNELIKNSNQNKVLSVLNSLLENGVYNYQKQFSQKIRAGNLFYFMGNMSNNLNFPLILLGMFGNVETLGRRIGIITYNNYSKGFVKGNTRTHQITPYLNAMSIFLSNIFNHILENTKFLIKLYKHKEYIKMSKKYSDDVIKLCDKVEDETTLSFFKSHKSSIDRIIIRGLKIHLFNNIDEYIKNGFTYDNHLIFNVLNETKIHMQTNLINLKNIKEHITNFNIKDKTIEINQANYNKLPKTYKKLLRFFWENKKNIDAKGINVEYLKNRSNIKFVLQNYKRLGFPQKHKMFLLQYGLNITLFNNIIIFRIINIKLFESSMNGIIKNIGNVKKHKNIEKTLNNNKIDDALIDDLD